MKTRVFITIDTEFSIGGAFADPVANKPVGPQTVLCDIDGESHGLGFLLETFRDHGIRATFFVEALNTNYFGDEPMGTLARDIASAGHDVQLHLHPCWTYFKDPNWVRTLKTAPPSDHMHSRSLQQLVDWMSEGIDTFRRWGLPAPSALRTGSMMADRTVYQAMEQVGLGIASNIGLAMYKPEDPELHLFSGIQRVGTVLELCVLTYVDFSLRRRVHYRSLTTTGSSWAEMRCLLDQAHAAGVESVVLLTHAFEYVKYDRQDFAELRPNRINQNRLNRLCEFLRAHEDRFEAATFGELSSASIDASKNNTILKVPVYSTIERMLVNGLNGRLRAL